MLVYECVMIMLMLCKSSYGRLTPEVLHFGRTLWNSYVTWVLWNLISVHLEAVLVSEHDSCTVCAKHTIGSKTFWTHPLVLLSDEAQVEARFCPFGDIANPYAS